MALNTTNDRALINVVAAYEREIMGPKLTATPAYPNRRDGRSGCYWTRFTPPSRRGEGRGRGLLTGEAWDKSSPRDRGRLIGISGRRRHLGGSVWLDFMYMMCELHVGCKTYTHPVCCAWTADGGRLPSCSSTLDTRKEESARRLKT